MLFIVISNCMQCPAHRASLDGETVKLVDNYYEILSFYIKTKLCIVKKLPNKKTFNGNNTNCPNANFKEFNIQINAMEMGKFMIVVSYNCIDILRRVFVGH